MSDTTPFPDPQRPVDPRSDPHPGAVDPRTQIAGQGHAMPAGDDTTPLTSGFGTAPGTPVRGTPPTALPGADLEATLPLMPAVGSPFLGQPPVATPPGGWPPADPMGPPRWAQGQPGYGQPPYGQVPYGPAPYGQPAYDQPPAFAPYGQVPYGTPAGGTPIPPYGADDGWGPEAGPQAGTAYGTRPPTPPSGIRRGGQGGDGGRGPSVMLIGSVIGVAAVLAVAVWLLMFRPAAETAFSGPTPGATTFVTPPPTATPDPSSTADPSPEATRFRNPTFAGLRVTDADQEPTDGGELRPRGTLRLLVAVPVTTTAVPTVRGQAEADAVAAILDAGLELGSRQERFHGSVPAGAVIRTDPPAGDIVPLGAPVDYLVSLGPEPTPTPSPTPDPTPSPTLSMVEVPDLRGQSEADGISALIDAGLTPGDRINRYNDTVPADAIVRTNPPAGEPVAPGTTVDYVISRGPQPTASPAPSPTPEPTPSPIPTPDLVTVPALRGLTEADGIALLVDAGLVPGRRLERFNDTIAAGLVVRTDPAADAAVPAGAEVDYVISRGPDADPAPEFVGLSLEEARTLAEGAGLTLDVSEQEDDRVPTGIVLAQDPPAGEPLTGPTVAVVTARNTALVTVPLLRGQPEGDAIAQLVEAGLTPGRRLERYNATVDAGLLLRTDPAADTQVEPGTTVDYVISRGPEPRPVPDVSGLPLGDAEGVARDNDLALEVRYEDTLEAPADTVLRQEPSAGEPGDGSGTIRVVVARAPSTVVIPRLRGVPEDDAIAALLDAGLTPGDRTERANPTIPAGSLLSTDPRGQNEVPPGTVIDYVVSTGPGGGRPDPTPEPTRAPRDTPEPTPDGGGSGRDPGSELEGVFRQAAAIRELEQLAGVPVEVVLQRQLRQAMRSVSGGGSAAETATLERLGLIPPGTDVARVHLDLLANGTVAWYDPAAKVLKVRDNALDAVLRFFAAGEAGKALIDQRLGLGFLQTDDPLQTDRATARAALLGGDQALLMIDWAGQHLGPDEQAQLPGLISTDPGVLQSAPLYLRRLFTFPTEEGRAFVQALRDSGGWAAVTEAYGRLPASTEQILHPEKFRGDRPVTIDVGDPSGALGGGWSVTDVRTLGELGIGVWLDDGVDGAPNAWAADGWGGDRVVTLDGPDGAWAVVWQTAWDSDADADEFAGMAEQAMADLPGAHVVLRGADLAGGLPSPALVVIASDQSVIDTFLAGSGLGG